MPIRKQNGKSGTKYIPYVNQTVNGVRKKHYGPTCSSQKEAKAVLKRLEYDLEMLKRLDENGIAVVSSTNSSNILKTTQKKPETTWNEAFEVYHAYKVSQRIGFSQLDHIETRYRKYIGPFFKNKTLENTSKMDVIKFQEFLINVDQADYSNNRSGPLTPATINKIMEVTKAIFTTTDNVKDLGLKSPFIVKPIKEGEFRSGFYTKEEFTRYLNVIDDPRDRILFSLLFFTGLRIGEATALTYNDVIGKNRCIHINKTRKRASRNDGNNTIGKPKTDSSIRNVYITEELERMILEYRENQKKEKVHFSDDWFIFGEKKPISFQTVRRHHLKYASLVDLPAIRVHDFRGSFTTNMFEHTTNIKLVSNALGHSTLATTTKHYLKAKESDKKALFEKAAL